MVTQFGLSPTSTLADARAVLQKAIEQEEDTLRVSQERLTVYQQQLASLAALVSLSSEGTTATTFETTPDATNGATAVETNGATPVVSNGVTPPVEAKAIPKRTGGQSPKRSTNKTAAKRAGSRVKAAAKTPPVAAETPVTEPTPVAAPAPTVAAEPPELPKLLKAYRGKPLDEAVQTVLSEVNTPLSAKEIAQKLYGKKLLEDNVAVSQQLTRLVSRSLKQGVGESLLAKEGYRPVLYRLLTAAPVAV